MDSKQAILQAATQLIMEKGDQLSAITVRDICRRADVGLGLVNYHFGSKDALIDQCVEKIINGIVDNFGRIREKTDTLPPLEKLLFLGDMTFTFLLEHEAVCRVSVLSDLAHPKEDDNTHRTFAAYLPLVAACRPAWSEQVVREKTFYLITLMQQSFLRHEQIGASLGVDLKDPAQRSAWHKNIVEQLLGEGES